MRKCYALFFLAASACTQHACSDKSSPPAPEEPDPTPRATIYDNASLVYYGVEDEEMPSSLFELTLYTDMELDAGDNPIGPGQILRVSFNAPLFPPETEEFPLPAATYYSASSFTDFTPGTIGFGYMNRLDLPSGIVEVPAGSFYGDIAEGQTTFDADLLTDGQCEVTLADDGAYTVSGILVGDRSTKRRFTYTGELRTIDRSDHTPIVPNTTLKEDLTLGNLTQARLRDRGDYYFLGDESYRLFELYLAEAGADLTPTWPVGSGRMLRLEFFVAWDTEVAHGIPAGTYTVVPRENGGLDRVHIRPGNMPAGAPGRFANPAGCWYQRFEQDELTEYACVYAGTVQVTQTDGGTRFTVDFSDSDDPAAAHRIRCQTEWRGDLPTAP